MDGNDTALRNEGINDGSVYNCKFHSVFPLCKTALFRAYAIDRAHESVKQFFVKFNSAHRFLSVLSSNFSYILMPIEKVRDGTLFFSRCALVRGKSNSVANRSRRFLSVSFSLSLHLSLIYTHSVNIPLEDEPCGTSISS